MTAKSITTNTSVEALNKAFLLYYPKDAARKIETMLPEDAAKLMGDLPTSILKPVWRNLSPGVVDNVLLNCPDKTAAELLASMESGPCAALLNRLSLKKTRAVSGAFRRENRGGVTRVNGISGG